MADRWTAYADGSCIGNPGRGGWGVVVIAPDHASSELAGADPATTNNRMELTAAIEALRRTPPGADLIVRSDSQYLVKTMTLGWKRRENLDLWRTLDDEAARRRVRWEWVRGHNGDQLNERADELARSAAEGREPRPALAANLTPGPFPKGKGRSEVAALEPLLRPDEEIRGCASCGRDFVSVDDARYCSLVECQLIARRNA